MATRFEEIQIERVHANAANIREDMGDMETLTTEVKTIGIRNPLLVYPHPTHDGDFMVQDGHRRLEAASANGALFVPCLIIDAPKRGLREDIEVMLSTGRAAKVLNPLEVSFGFEQLVADGMDETTIGKKYKVPKSEVKTRARVSTAPETLKAGFAGGRLSLVDMKRIQDLEDAGVPEVFDKVVETLASEVSAGWRINVENIIVTKQSAHERELLRESLVSQGATEAAGYSVTYDGKFEEVTELGLSVDQHVDGKHVFYLTAGGVQWFAKRLVAKNEPTAEEVREAQERRSLDAGLAIQSRVRRKFIVDQVIAKDGGAGPAADAALLFDLMWEKIQEADDDLLAGMSGIAIPEETEDSDDTAVRDTWLARVEKKFRAMPWQQLARAATVAGQSGQDRRLAKLAGFDRNDYCWVNVRDWYKSLQEHFGYRLDESERNAVLWGELKGGVSRYYGGGDGPDEGMNRMASEDLVIIDAEVSQ